MKTHLLALCILLGSFLSITFAYGDDIPAHGKWDDERYRSIHVLPPTLSIEGNILSVHFTEALNDLTIRIMDHAGNICMRIYFPEKQEILSTFHWTG